ncbi:MULTISPECIES: glycosyltransferase family 2 protein [unclassified Oleiphilus]|uniref:glycosyltransferase n=1 Tax=unclassified Oleiphilus TaxID=2631174 RepID=UPI0007C37B08|nr:MULTISPECIES: glycosyltransferase [unclassified Oleiphilus]KZY69649.1 hypothetical protein A3738_15720 [Oleiphilus sp. HI0066]KZY73404.1 hypothetical protein A3739_02700 [Oleiphilus sp. HI0067]
MTSIEVDELPFVSVIIPCYNEEEYVEGCLSALLAQSYPQDCYEIILVDNGSSDKSVEISSKYPIRVVSKLGGKVGGVRNFGASLAKGGILAFIDADCIAPENWIKDSVHMLLMESSLGAVGGSYLSRDKPTWVERCWVLASEPEDGPTSILVGGSFIIKRNIFDEIGGFDEVINAGEDTKLAYQVASLGYSLRKLHGAAVVHMGYPQTLTDFFKRQFWHSSSLIHSKTSLFDDKTFIAVVVFSLLILMLPLSFFYSPALGGLNVILLVMIPLLFTCKRVNRAQVTFNASRLVGAFALDVNYFIAKACGLATSLFSDPYKRKNSSTE